MTLRTKGKMANKLQVKKLEVPDLMFKTIGEYERLIYYFYTNIMNVMDKKEDQRLYQMFAENKEFQNSILDGFIKFNKEALKEFYDYDFPTDLQLYFL
jgi:hypothetical protein